MNFIFNSPVILRYVLAPAVWLTDKVIPKNKKYWGFSVHHIKSDQFIENSRAIFETVKHDKEIKKIIFSRGVKSDFNIDEAVNFEVVDIKSLRGIFLLLKCKVLFVTNSISMDYSVRYGLNKFVILRLNFNKRFVINLWHGISIKKLNALWNQKVKERMNRGTYRQNERKQYTGLVTSSEIDSYAMAAMFYPIKFENIWQTGLPRNDFLSKEYNYLPKYLKVEIDKIKKIKSGRKLILYAPTYRQTSAVKDSEYYQFSFKEITKLKALLVEHNAILAIRLHYFRNNETLFNIEKFIDNELIFDLGHHVATEIASVIRESDIIISDYSSVFIEAMFLNKRLISFAYDIEHYKEHQDGLLYDFNLIFPGFVCSTTEQLFSSITNSFHKPSTEDLVRYNMSKKIFFSQIDSNNSLRVVSKVKDVLSYD